MYLIDLTELQYSTLMWAWKRRESNGQYGTIHLLSISISRVTPPILIFSLALIPPSSGRVWGCEGCGCVLFSRPPTPTHPSIITSKTPSEVEATLSTKTIDFVSSCMGINRIRLCEFCLVTIKSLVTPNTISNSTCSSIMPEIQFCMWHMGYMLRKFEAVILFARTDRKTLKSG